jgi:hypothetical protein
VTAIDGSVTLGGVIVAYTVPVAPGAAGWELVDCGLTSIGRRRDVVTSPWVNDDVEVASVRAALKYQVKIRAVAASFGEASAMVADAVAAVEQTAWTLVEALDGHTETYACRAAETIDMPKANDLVINARREMTITIPVRRA